MVKISKNRLNRLNMVDQNAQIGLQGSFVVAKIKNIYRSSLQIDSYSSKSTKKAYFWTKTSTTISQGNPPFLQHFFWRIWMLHKGVRPVLLIESFPNNESIFKMINP